MNVINKIYKGDKVIWIVALLLCIISLIVVYSATSALAVSKYEGSTGRVLIKHFSMLLLGILMMIGASRISYKHYAKIALLLLIPCLALLLYTLFFGRNINDASRSINVGGFSFQPSEMAKIILITYLARQVVMMEKSLFRFQNFLYKIAFPIVATVGLIFTENLSTALILTTVCIVLLFIGRVKILHIMALIGICIVLMGIYLGYDAISTNVQNNRNLKRYTEKVESGNATEEFREKQNRIQTWHNRLKTMGEKEENIDPFDDKHMQRTYADIAVASSSILGKGPGKSEQRNFLPHPYSDFIYAIIVEEYGLVGAIFVLLLYVILFTRVLRIMLKRPLTFGALMSFGLGFLIILQALINMGVSIGLLPVTGQPLPFISMGGTSLMATGIILGMILSVTRDIDEQSEILEAVTVNEESQQLTKTSKDGDKE